LPANCPRNREEQRTHLLFTNLHPKITPASSLISPAATHPNSDWRMILYWRAARAKTVLEEEKGFRFFANIFEYDIQILWAEEG
jgi:hypothetical protein